MSDYFQGKSAWVFGGSQGIGLALAEQLKQRGARLTLVARRAPLLEQEGNRLGAAWMSLDVGDYAQTDLAVHQLLVEQGPPQLVFNCAGLALPGYLTDLSSADIVAMNQVNYLGTVHVCKAVLPTLLRQGSGHIVNLSSIFGIIAPPGQTAYCAAKFAVRGFSESLRHELAMANSPVRLSVVHP
ncbi:SDR family NAD(P)-dependent oxidoreductase, partial [bacterium]|nr:SDR family NAD(P)-dependent oxidoreductase [bacterium]